ncbi:unnamed protein product [Alternaria alternata]
MTELERQVALLKSRGLMVPTTDPRTSKRPAEESSPEPSSKKTKHTTEIASKRQLHAHSILQREFLLQKAELQRTKQELAAEKAKSAYSSNQIKLLCGQCCRLTDRYHAALASHASLQATYRDQASELRAHKGALDIANEELEESRKDADTYREAMLKRDEDYELAKKQLEEAKEDKVLQWRMLTSRLQSLGKGHEMGRAVYDMLLVQVERQCGEDRIVLESVKEALKDAFGGLFERE